MKKFNLILAVALLSVLPACNNDLWDSIHGIENQITTLDARVTRLEELCKEMNTNITALQTIVNVLQTNDYITSVTEVKKGGEVIGYTITFGKHNPITIYHGENGTDGKDGKDGIDGTNGQDGHTPVIGVAQDTDGIYYWTLDGEWLLDDNGNKLRVTGENGADGTNGTNGTNGTDGITPQLKIEGDYWFISYDNGATWTQLGKAKGDKGDNGTNGTNGQDGDSMFQSVTQDTDNVYFTLTDGTVITVAKNNAISSPDGYNVTGTKNGYQYVDLALPSGTKWATCNIGSNLPAGRGKMFAWGETEVKSEYTQANYVPNYNSLPDCVSGTQYDAVTANLGAPWQIPTKVQMQELVNYATFTETTYNDVAGYRVTGPNGNSIFMPKFPGNYATMNFIYMTGDRQTDNTQYKNCIYCLVPDMFKNEQESYSALYAPSSFPAVRYQQHWSRLTTGQGIQGFYDYFYYSTGYHIRPVWNE